MQYVRTRVRAGTSRPLSHRPFWELSGHAPPQLHVRLVLDGNGGVFERHYTLFQPVKPAECKFEILSVKVEVTLRKANGISWASFEKTDGALLSWTTFGIEVRCPRTTTRVVRGPYAHSPGLMDPHPRAV